jgi:hypothetical protein
MTQSGFVHFCYPPASSHWVLRLLSRLHQSSSSQLKQRVLASWETTLAELALAVSSKIHLVGIAVKRVDADIHRIAGEVQQREAEVISLIDSDACLLIRDEGVLFEALLDIESFLFEMRSTLEITEIFIKKFRQNILDDGEGRQQSLRDCFNRLGIDQSWYETLRLARNLFSHQTAPWLAMTVRTTDPDPPHFDLVVLKKNEIVPEPPDYFHFDDCRKMYRGYFDAMEQLHAWLLSQIDSCV